MLLLNVPAVRPVRPSDHIADVAPPPNEPPKATVVPPWQIAGIAGPASTVGVGFKSTVAVIGRVGQPFADGVIVKVIVIADMLL